MGSMCQGVLIAFLIQLYRHLWSESRFLHLYQLALLLCFFLFSNFLIPTCMSLASFTFLISIFRYTSSVTILLKTSMCSLSLIGGLNRDLFLRVVCWNSLMVAIFILLSAGWDIMYFLILSFLIYFCRSTYMSNVFIFLIGAYFEPLSKTFFTEKGFYPCKHCYTCEKTKQKKEYKKKYLYSYRYMKGISN